MKESENNLLVNIHLVRSLFSKHFKIGFDKIKFEKLNNYLDSNLSISIDDYGDVVFEEDLLGIKFDALKLNYRYFEEYEKSVIEYGHCSDGESIGEFINNNNHNDYTFFCIVKLNNLKCTEIKVLTTKKLIDLLKQPTPLALETMLLPYDNYMVNLHKCYFNTIEFTSTLN